MGEKVVEELQGLSFLTDGVYLVNSRKYSEILLKCEKCSGWKEFVDTGITIEDLLGQALLHCDRAHSVEYA